MRAKSVHVVRVHVDLLEEAAHHVLGLFNLKLFARHFIQLSYSANKRCHILFDNRLFNVFLSYELKVLLREKLRVEAMPGHHFEGRAGGLLLSLFRAKTNTRNKIHSIDVYSVWLCAQTEKLLRQLWAGAKLVICSC